MISTVAELLDAIMRQEVKMFDQQKIKHAPTIGSMYEGLRQNILELALPSGLDWDNSDPRLTDWIMLNRFNGISK